MRIFIEGFLNKYVRKQPVCDVELMAKYIKRKISANLDLSVIEAALYIESIYIDKMIGENKTVWANEAADYVKDNWQGHKEELKRYFDVEEITASKGLLKEIFNIETDYLKLIGLIN